jgi:hypothetical protein
MKMYLFSFFRQELVVEERNTTHGPSINLGNGRKYESRENSRLLEE